MPRQDLEAREELVFRLRWERGHSRQKFSMAATGAGWSMGGAHSLSTWVLGLQGNNDESGTEASQTKRTPGKGGVL